MHAPTRSPVQYKIPTREADKAIEFAHFAKSIAADPGRYRMAADDAAKLLEAVQKFVDLHQRCWDPSQKTTLLVAQKNAALHAAEKLMRQWIQWVRAQPSDRVDLADKYNLGFVEAKQ